MKEMKKMTKKEVKKLFELFKKEFSITPVSFERTFGLKIGTVKQWERGTISAADSALLRIIAAYPWMYAIAEKKFEPIFAQGRMIVQAGLNIMSLADKSPEVK